MIGMTSLRRTMMPSTNEGAVGMEVEPVYGTIWRTAMMSRTNVSRPTRKVIRRTSVAVAIRLLSLSTNPEFTDLVVEAADGVVQQRDRGAHVARGGTVVVRDRAHLLHRRHDLFAFRGLVGGDLED